jgi:outer membrane protein assembly factor BamB
LTKAIRGYSPTLTLLLCLLGWCVFAPYASAYDWLQFNGNAQHDGNNTREVRLSASNVNQLTRHYQIALPASADGVPVFLEQVTTPAGVKDLLFVTTDQGHILALDASTGATVWSHQFAFSAAPASSSPAIDPNRRYVYSYGREGFVHKFQVGDGTEIVTGGWPQLVTLKPNVEKVSSSLATAKANGTTYLYAVTSGYPGDAGDYQGHVVAIDLATGLQKIFNSLCSDKAFHLAASPPASDCAQVQSGAWARPGVIYDAGTNRIFFGTGNGPYDAANNHWSDSVLAVTPDGSGSGGKPIDAYTPASFQSLQNQDADLGSTAPAILPVPGNSNVQHLAAMGGKDGLLRLINLANLSGQSGPGHTGGEIGGLGINVGPVVLSQPAVWVNPADTSTWLFLANGNGTSAFRLSIDGSGNPSLVSKWSGASGGNSSPLIANNVLFVASGSSVRALDPVNKTVLWTSAAGAIGNIKWQSPMVANCALYVADQSSQLSAFTLPVSLSSLPMKVAPVSVNGGANPLQNTGFDVVVQSLDCFSAPQNVAVDTVVSLSVAVGTGALGGTQGCTILAGDNACTVSGMTYSVAEAGVVLAAVRASGDDLGSGISAPFNVIGNGTTPLLQGAASRKAHVGAGTFDLPLAP